MPVVNGKHYSYSPAGYKAVAKAKKKSKNYNKEQIAMARKLIK